MMPLTNAVEGIAALHIGTVAAVAPDRITVFLDGEAPQTTALNTGVPTAFPRLNSYVLLPNEAGAVVGLVVWLGIERAPGINRNAAGAMDVVDLPFPHRKMLVTPVGTLVTERGADVRYRMERGVAAFPGVGDQVLLPTREQLLAVVEPTGADRRVELGRAVLAGDARVAVDPDKLFGRHVAVLGNTGSGKSCSVAGLVRWSLQAAAQASPDKAPNARFIILDPNGEYGTAFEDLPGGVRRFRVPPVDTAAKPLVVPTWMWNGHEWGAFAQASPRVQRPLLMQALRDLRSAGGSADGEERILRRMHLRLTQAGDWVRSLNPQGQDWRAALDVGNRMSRVVEDSQAAANAVQDPGAKTALNVCANAVNGVLAARRKGKYFDPFGDADFQQLLDAMNEAAGGLPELPPIGLESEDAPVPFEPDELADRLRVLAQDEASGNAAGFVATLLMRVRTMLADRRMRPVIAPRDSVSFDEWLADVVGESDADNGAVAVVDLSLVPSDVVHVVVSVLARVVFEATQRYRRMNAQELPTVLVLEEAHTFVRRYEQDVGDAPTPAQLCRQTFERIAREGRKFGLGLVLSSQRPSELSATVLAQCNTFLLHRLVNDRDQDLVSRLVPDNLAGLLQELPTLPTRHAVLLGWATPLPVLMQVRELKAEHRPKSADPAFWRTWIRETQRPIDWPAIVSDWAGDGVDGATSEEPGCDAPAGDEPFSG